MKKTLIIPFLLLVLSANAQSFRKEFSDTLKSVTLDSTLVITAKRGLSMNDFIEVMRNDTDFYQSFKQLRLFSFQANNRIETFDSNNRLEGKMIRKIKHDNSTPNYKQTELLKVDSGKVYRKNGDYDLYTVRMFSYIFMNDKNTDFTKQAISNRADTDEEGYKQKLKTLIFNPGTSVKGIPLISDKTEIFSEELSKYYDFTFYHATYQDSIPVYYFKCKTKSNLTWWKEDDTMIKELTTIFDARSLRILGRYIDMRYSSIPFDFNVKMNIELSYITEDIAVPTYISYDGDWDIPFKKKEICTFEIKHINFKKGYSIK